MFMITSKLSEDDLVVKARSFISPAETDYSILPATLFYLFLFSFILTLVLLNIKRFSKFSKLIAIVTSIMVVLFVSFLVVVFKESNAPEKANIEKHLSEANNSVDKMISKKYDATIEDSAFKINYSFMFGPASLVFDGGDLEYNSYKELTFSDGHKAKVILELSKDGRDITAYPVIEEIERGNVFSKNSINKDSESDESSVKEKLDPLSPVSMN
jgi:Ca2+/Na+ antiporter